MVTQGLLYYLAKHQELNQIIERECKIEKHMFRFKNSLKTSNSTSCKRVQNSKGQVENSKLIWHSIRLCFSKLSPIELTHSNHSWNFIQLCLGPRDEISLCRPSSGCIRAHTGWAGSKVDRTWHLFQWCRHERRYDFEAEGPLEPSMWPGQRLSSQWPYLHNFGGEPRVPWWGRSLGVVCTVVYWESDLK